MAAACPGSWLRSVDPDDNVWRTERKNVATLIGRSEATQEEIILWLANQVIRPTIADVYWTLSASGTWTEARKL